MRAYSEDLRARIVHCVTSGQDVNEVAELFGVSARSVERYVKQQREHGDLAPKKHPGRQPLLGEEHLQALRENLRKEPGLTLAERCDRLQAEVGVRVSVPTMHRWVKRLGYARKKAPSAPSSETRASAGRS